MTYEIHTVSIAYPYPIDTQRPETETETDTKTETERDTGKGIARGRGVQDLIALYPKGLSELHINRRALDGRKNLWFQLPYMLQHYTWRLIYAF